MNDVPALAATALATSDAELAMERSDARLGRGARVDRYVIDGVLGSGGMGIVYRAVDPELGRPVALKLVHTQASGSTPTSLGQARLLREAQAMAKVAHPNIVTVYDVGVARDQVFVAMELVDGLSMAAWLREHRPSWREVVHVMQQAGRGLEAAHAAGLVHRDFKPDNVLIGRDGRVRVVDLGLARTTATTDSDTSAPALDRDPSVPTLDREAPASTTDREPAAPATGSKSAPPLAETDLGSRPPGSDADLTRTGAVMGTPLYMAPEQHRGEIVDARSDQFSFCITLYEGLYGKCPFFGATRHELMRSVLAGRQIEPPRDARVPRWLQRVVQRGLAVAPDARYPSMTALLDALDRGLRRSWRLWLGGTSIAALATTAVLLALPGPASPPPPPPPTPEPPAAVAGVALPVLLPTVVHRQVTFTGSADTPRLSPDGRHLAYLGEQQSLFVQELATGRATMLSRWPLVYEVRWSPDGANLLVSTTRGIFTVPREGGERVFQSGVASYVAWSGDGRRYVSGWQPPQELEFVDIAGGAAQRIPTRLPSTFIDGLDWSPATGLILLLTSEKSGSALWTLSPDGGELRRIHQMSTLFATTPLWTGSDSFMYMRAGEDESEIVAMRLGPDGDAEEVGSILRSESVSEFHGYSFSGDGKRLAYTAVHRDQNIVRMSPADADPRSVRVDLTRLTTGTQTKRHVVPSPDGTMVAFVMSAGALVGQIFVMPLAGGTPRQITTRPEKLVRLAWSPDGRSIAYTLEVDGAVQLWRVDVDSGQASRFAVDDLSADLAWAPGKSILVQRHGNRNFEVLDPDTGAHHPLVADDSVGWMFSPVYSPDGERLVVYWNRRDRGLWEVSPSDGTHARIAPGHLAPVGWSPDGASIYTYESTSIAATSVKTGQTRPLIFIPAGVELQGVVHVPGTSSFVAIDYQDKRDVWLTGEFPADAVAKIAVPPDESSEPLPPGYPAALNPAPLNLDFEAGEVGAVPTGWHLSEASRRWTTAVLTKDRPYRGSACAFVDGSESRGYANLLQYVDVAPFRGKRLRLRGALRVDATGAPDTSAGLWLRTEKSRSDDNLHQLEPDDRVTASEWTTREVTMDIPADAELLAIGADLIGEGNTWIDALTLEVVRPRR